MIEGTAQRADKVLIVGPAWIGDMVMAQSLFKFLIKHRSNLTIDVLAPAWSQPILNRMPEVATAISFPFQHGEFKLQERYRFAKEKLRDVGYQQAFVLPNSFKSALVPFFAKIPFRTGWRGEFRYGLLNDLRYLDEQQLPLMVQRFLALGLKKNDASSFEIKDYYPQLSISSLEVSNKLSSYQISKTQNPILVLCPGAEFGVSKRWLPDYFAEVAKTKMSCGWDVWLFGSKNDQDVANNIMQLTENRCINLVGKTSLEDAIDLLSLATAVLTNDSGLMHIAAALNRPLVVIYGSTSAKFTPPLTDSVRILSSTLPCSPCFKRICPLKHFNCMKNIMPQHVLEALDDLVAL